VGAAVVHDNVRTAAVQTARDCRADSPRRARHQRDFSVQCFVHGAGEF
jgi:hypothetical protein